MRCNSPRRFCDMLTVNLHTRHVCMRPAEASSPALSQGLLRHSTGWSASLPFACWRSSVGRLGRTNHCPSRPNSPRQSRFVFGTSNAEVALGMKLCPECGVQKCGTLRANKMLSKAGRAAITLLWTALEPFDRAAAGPGTEKSRSNGASRESKSHPVCNHV